MKILITGADGMLGSDLQNVLNMSKKNEIIATDLDLDITKESVIEKIRKCAPDIVVNVAAYTDVDGCEFNQELAYKINSIGPKNLALACKEINSKLIHISTDYVFNGEKKEPYIESDKTNPINVYGETKLKGEELIQNTFDDYFILRTSWLYGINGNNFVKTMLELSKSNNEISVVDDQRGSPTYTYDLSIAISKLLENNHYGIYHLTNSGNCSWFEFTKDIFEIANIDVDLKPVATEKFPRSAKRPKYSVLNNEKWKNKGFKPLRNYKKALNDFIDLMQ
jgi:dTDP-4-dehydrorhamnose reductase